jgi:antitoxin component YwqK of YwqJK toxin-antitoxin module
MDILNNNIIEYILNLYLDYVDDVQKLKQLYNFKFNIKSHLTHYISFYGGKKKIKNKSLYLDNKPIKIKKYFYNGNKSSLWKCTNLNDNSIFECWYKNGKNSYVANMQKGKYHGFFEEWNMMGYYRRKANYENGKLNGIQKYYTYDEKFIYEEIRENGKLINENKINRNKEIDKNFIIT